MAPIGAVGAVGGAGKTRSISPEVKKFLQSIPKWRREIIKAWKEGDCEGANNLTENLNNFLMAFYRKANPCEKQALKRLAENLFNPHSLGGGALPNLIGSARSYKGSECSILLSLKKGPDKKPLSSYQKKALAALRPLPASAYDYGSKIRLLTKADMTELRVSYANKRALILLEEADFDIEVWREAVKKDVKIQYSLKFIAENDPDLVWAFARGETGQLALEAGQVDAYYEYLMENYYNKEL